MAPINLSLIILEDKETPSQSVGQIGKKDFSEDEKCG